MQNVLITVVSALYASCPYHVLLCMQSVIIIQCYICKVSLLFSAVYVKCPYYVVLYVVRHPGRCNCCVARWVRIAMPVPAGECPCGAENVLGADRSWRT